MDMPPRIRIELAEQRGYSAYGLAKATGLIISTSTAYRLTESRGVMEYFDAKTLEALKTLLGLKHYGELITDDPPTPKPPPRKGGKKPAKRTRKRG